MLKFRAKRDNEMIRYILENNLIEKAYLEVKIEEIQNANNTEHNSE